MICQVNFTTVIEPIFGIKLAIPDRLNEVLHRKSMAIDSSATLNAVTDIVKQHFFSTDIWSGLC